jgi:preprotein translocase subunit SecG
MTITADHPARGDAWVVRRAARCGNVAGAGAAIGQHAQSVPCERGEEAAMSVLWWILFAVIWIAIAFWPARVAGRKGHSFIGYFIFSLFFFPAALLVAYLTHDRTGVPGAARTAVS